ncbi:hypothetical protein [Nocardioides flavescens]|uniref:Lipoprotein LpqN n=1 Tax=Nocardioides flavescens TaxID=2691959 RepID=A0A6L7EZI9_9ACTN|nr:hypothetical protein [Nocardioides flavescens]MXG89072.1 hypothetical protein [Nocardioides flavescens]
MTAIAAAAFSACSSGTDDDPGDAASPEQSSAASSPAQSPSERPSEVQTSGSASTSTGPSVAPATGPLIAVGTSSFRAPDGWVEDGGISQDQNSARRPGGGGLVIVGDMAAFGSAAPLDARVQVALDQAPKGATRLPDVSLGDDGTLAGVITYKEGGNTVVDVMTERAGRVVNVSFTLRPSDLKADPDLVESVLASWQWVAGGSS